MGRTFREWLRQLERLGYVVEWKELDASRYGAPTRRKRLFVVARCDGDPIRWPAPTHGPGLQPFRTAGECIDWSIPSRSIFDRKKPLAEKTLHRIAEGIRRFVVDNPRPYIVPVNHGGGTERCHDSREPLPTTTASRRSHAVVAPHFVRMSHGEQAPGGSKRWGKGAHDPAQPLPTVTASSGGGGYALGMPYLVNTRNGERKGQSPRVRSLFDPAPTVTAKGSQGAIASVALVDMQRDNAPRSLDEPLGVITTQGNRWNELRATVTARDHHSPVAATLVKFRGECNGASLDDPMPTVTAQGLHIAECRAFLVKYFGAAKHGQTLFDGLHTVTSKPRFGLVVVDGQEYEIADIYLRMLDPHELLAAQFGEFANGYDLSAARTKEAKTRLVGNSVCPHVAAALVRANVVLTSSAATAS
jgi:DNA (cytosine-5)-methyltransferase 1